MERTFKILIISIFLILFIYTFSCVCSAEENPEYITVSYYTGDTFKESENCIKGTEYVLKDKLYSKADINKTFYGWFTESGELYAPGETVNLTENTKFIEAYGREVSNESDLKTYMYKSFYYIKLENDITVSSVIGLADCGVSVLDLNSHSLTISSEKSSGFDNQRGGLILLGNGTVNYYCADAPKAHFYTTKVHGWGDGGQRLWIGKGVTVVSNGDLVYTYGNMVSKEGLPSIKIYGNVTAKTIIRSCGMFNAPIDIYDGAHVDISGDYLVYDSTTEECNIANITFYGGEIDLGENTSFVDDLSRYKLLFKGGSFSKDVSRYISLEYKCVFDELTSRYTVVENKCTVSETGKHKYRASALTVTCTQDGTITYTCAYCGDSYTIDRFALGHTTVMTLDKLMVNTKEKTEPGYYTQTCVRCGEEYKEYFYPNPTQVYVTVVFRKDGEEVTFRTESKNLFGFSGTKLTSFSFLELYNGDEKFKQDELIGLEIPLGTTEIVNGLFKGNTNIEEIYLPRSLEITGKECFQNMSKIRKITGIEYISTTIGEYSFSQSHNNLRFEDLTVNATNILNGSFTNVIMKRLYITKNVSAIRGNAFGLDSKYQCELKEIFVEGYGKDSEFDGEDGIKLNEFQSKYNFFKLYDNNGQIANKSIVFATHHFEETVVDPICIKDGYTEHKCLNCGLTYEDNIVKTTIKHNFVRSEEDDVQSTCSKQGYLAYKCTMCNSIDKSHILPYDPDNHDYTYKYEYDVYPCEQVHKKIGICVCGERQPESEWEDEQPLGHDMIETEYVKYTCGTDGYRIKECSRCDKVEKEIFKARGLHSWIEDAANTVPATCAREGTLAYKCEVCGETKQTKVPVNEDAHEWDDGEVVQTDKNDVGAKIYTCKLCGQTKRELISIHTRDKMPTWAIVLIAGGSALLLAGVGLTVYYTIFRKRNASENYKYKFNTFNKK